MFILIEHSMGSSINARYLIQCIWWRRQMEYFPRYWPFVRGIYRSPVNSPHKGQWGEALMFSSICAWINGWVNNRGAGELRRRRAHYFVSVINKANAPVNSLSTNQLQTRQDCNLCTFLDITECRLFILIHRAV